VNARRERGPSLSSSVSLPSMQGAAASENRELVLGGQVSSARRGEGGSEHLVCVLRPRPLCNLIGGVAF